jgi:hypothetical protein
MSPATGASASGAAASRPFNAQAPRSMRFEAAAPRQALTA